MRQTHLPHRALARWAAITVGDSNSSRSRLELSGVTGADAETGPRLFKAWRPTVVRNCSAHGTPAVPFSVGRAKRLG